MEEMSTNDEISAKAWMSVRDGDLVESILLAVAPPLGHPLRVLEWGSGASTLAFTAALAGAGVDHLWLTLEYDRGFFREALAPALAADPTAAVVWSGDLEGMPAEALTTGTGIRAIVFDAGRLQPFLPEHLADRNVDLDDYVEAPERLGAHWDVVIVDGRKRRRCLNEAASLTTPDGVVLLHDAQRSWYRCAFDTFTSHRRIGDELWIGAMRVTDFADVVPQCGFAPPEVETAWR